MNTTIDQQFVEYIVKSLVGNPDAVKLTRRIDEKGVLLELTVDPEDLGRVIGKRGATAQSLRTLLRALGTKQDARYNLKIVDTSGGFRREEREEREDRVRFDEPENAPEAVQHEDVVEEAEEQKEEPKEEASDRLSRTRKELADLDDLDV